MASRQQMTGMRGIYLVAAELSRLGFVAFPTSTSAIGADILVTDQTCQSTFSVQIRTNARTFDFWLLTSKTGTFASKNHVYVLVNLRSGNSGERIEYFVVPSEVIADNCKYRKDKDSEWWFIELKDVEEYRNKWSVFDVC